MKYIYSVNPSKILIFDYEGKLKDQITINKNRIDHFHDIEFIPLTKFFILMQSNGFGNTPYSYHIYKEKSELVKKEIKPIQFKMNGSYTRNKEFSYYVVNNELFVKENLLNDTIYRVLPTLNFEPAFIIESGKYRCPVELRKNFMKFFMETDMKFVQLNNIYDCKNYLLFLFVFDKKKYFGFYNKILKKAYSFPHNGINNNYDGGLFFQPVYQLNNQLIGYFNAYDLIKHVRSEAFQNSTPKYPEKKKELEKLAGSLDENDNPVLMLVKLKE